MRIGILGSTCDPPHKEHIAIAETARDQLGLNKIILIPTYDPPHKNAPSVAPEMRLAMARLAIIGRPGWEVSDIELKRKGKTYTRDTIKTLRETYLKDELVWIIGSDSLASMPWKWRGGYAILDLCTFAAVPRKNYPLEAIAKKILDKTIIIKRAPSEISSSEIRNLIANRKDASRFLDSAVYQFIKKENLYAS